MIRIAHATVVHARNDTRIAVREAATAQRAFGDVTLFVRDGLGDGSGPGEVPIIDIGRARGGRLRRMTSGVWRMARTVSKARPAVAHFHDPELIPAGMWWKLRGIRVIYDAHEDVPRQILTKHYLPRWLRRPAAGGAALAERLAGRLFDATISATPSIGALFPPRTNAIVRNFPDLDELAFPDAPRETPPHFAYVGGISEIRGIGPLVRAMDLVDRADARLRLAGAFQPETLQTEVERLDGWRRVDFAGWLDRDGVRGLLGSVRAGVVTFLPAPNHENAQPNKLFEYMAAGLPLIASDFPSWRDLLGEIGCAVFVDPADPDSIARAMTWTLDNPEEARQMGRRGQVVVRERFNWSNEAQTLIETYSRLGLASRDRESP